MKKLNSKSIKSNRIFFALALLFFIAPQIQAQISIGGGLGYNEKISGPGITGKAEFNITEEIAISPGITYFFGSSLYGFNRNLLAVDANAHYFFEIIESKLKIYPLVGVNYSSYKSGSSTYYGYYYGTSKVSNSAFGANIGAGARWAFSDKLSVYLEPKYVASDYGQVVINAGVLYQL
ncbi:MAG TPA: outer membrane beta-barrel protein [Xanthomarina sp.]|nr:outer membrane beta-barrel protein [Xanthomarina sp.]